MEIVWVLSSPVGEWSNPHTLVKPRVDSVKPDEVMTVKHKVQILIGRTKCLNSLESSGGIIYGFRYKLPSAAYSNSAPTV